MPTIHFTLPNGTTAQVEGREGASLMQVATENAIPGIEAICGGFCNCATCHVYIGEAWISRLPPPASEEDEMLDGTAAERLPTSRLSCQVKVTAALSGIEVTMPDRQA